MSEIIRQRIDQLTRRCTTGIFLVNKTNRCTEF